jgi:hypothetical protein
MPIDYDVLSGERDLSAPPDGYCDAHLEHAKLVEGSSGDLLITEWSDGEHYWTSFNGFSGNRLRFTQELLDGLGVDRKAVTSDEELEAELDRVTGGRFRVKTDSKEGQNGVFVNTYVEGKAAEVPIAEVDQTEAVPVTGDDDDVPF